MSKIKRITSAFLVALLIATTVLPSIGVVTTYGEGSDSLNTEKDVVGIAEGLETSTDETDEELEEPEELETLEDLEESGELDESEEMEVPTESETQTDTEDMIIDTQSDELTDELDSLGDQVYLSDDGDDKNAGTKAAPVATFTEAVERLPGKEGTIVIVGQVTVTGAETWDGADKINIIRDAEYMKQMIVVEGDVAKLTIQNMVISGENIAADGALISVIKEAELNIANTTLEKNLNSGANGQGGGLYFEKDTEITFGSGTEVKENQAEYGGGIYGSGKITFEDTTVSGNKASKDGGGIYLVKTIGVHLRSEIATIDCLNIQNNQAVRNGGGLYLGYGVDNSMDFESEINMKGNRAQNGGGMYAGADVLYKKDPITDERLIGTMNFTGNSATRDGGGIYKVGNMQLGAGDVRANSAGRNGGGIYMASVGGKLIINGDTAKTSGSDSTIPTNAVVGGNSAGQDGGGIYIPNLADLQTKGVAFIRNTAAIGYACVNPPQNHPAEHAIYDANIDPDGLKTADLGSSGLLSFTESVGDWCYNNYDVSFAEPCDDQTQKIIVQWMIEDADGSTSVAFSYTAPDGIAGNKVMLSNDQSYTGIWNAMDNKVDDANPHTELTGEEYRFVKAEPASSTGEYTYGETAVVRYRYLSNEKSEMPTINTIDVDATSITGTGVAGATITVSVNGKEYFTTVADDGTWSVALTGITLTEGAVVRAWQTEIGLSSSGSYDESVRVANNLPTGVVIDEVYFYDMGDAVVAKDENKPALGSKKQFYTSDQSLDIRYNLSSKEFSDGDEPYFIIMPKGIVASISTTIKEEFFTVTIEEGSDKIVITFNNEAKEKEWDGYFFFTGKFDTSKLHDGNNHVEYELGNGDRNDAIDIFWDEHIPEIAKSGKMLGYQNNEPEGYVVEWTIKINTEKVLLEQMEITENLPEGMKYVSGEISYADDGQPANDDWVFQDEQGQTLRWSAHLEDKPSDRTYILTLRTVVTDFSKFTVDNNEQYKIPNEVTMGYVLPGGTVKSVSDAAEVTYDAKFIAKSGGFYSAGQQILWWDIEINANGETLEDVVVTDILGSEALEFGFCYPEWDEVTGEKKFGYIAPKKIQKLFDDDPTLKPENHLQELMIWDSDGSRMTGDKGVLLAGYDYFIEYEDVGTPNPKVNIRFPKIEERRVIRLYSYYTISDGGDMINTPMDLKNTAEISWENSDNWGLRDTELESEVHNEEMIYAMIEKDESHYDPLTQEITWSVVIDRYKVALTNPLIYELLGEGQKWTGSEENNWGIKIYTERTFDTEAPLRYRYKEADLYDEANYTVTQKTIDAQQETDWDYNVAPEKTLVLGFPQNLPASTKEKSSTELYMVIKTKVTDMDILASNQLGTFQNKAAIEAEELLVPKVDQKRQTVQGQIVEKLYNAFDPQENIVTWETIVNPDFVKFEKSFTITDEIAKEYTYEKGSVKVKRWAKETDPKEDEEKPEGEEVDLSSGAVIVDWNEETSGGGTLAVTIVNPEDYEYRIYFDTQVVNRDIFNETPGTTEIENELEFSCEEIEKEKTTKSSDSFTVDKKALKKEGNYTAYSDKIDWTVIIDATAAMKDANFAGFAGATLSDTLLPNLVIDEGSVFLTKWQWGVDADGQPELQEVADAGERNLTPVVSGQQVSITLPPDLKEEFVYKLAYTTYAEESGDYTNEIAVAGAKEYPAKTPNITVSEGQAGGGGETNSYVLKLKKQDEQGEPIEGVIFEVFDEAGNSLRKGATDDNGELTLQRLRYNTQYDLKETQAKVGYHPLEQEKIPFRVTKDTADVTTLIMADADETNYEAIWNSTDEYVEMKIINQPIEYEVAVVKYSTDDQAEERTPLATAEFILSREGALGTEYYKFDDTATPKVTWETNIKDATILVNGEFTLEGLLADTYTLTETEVPVGWLNKPLVVTITTGVVNVSGDITVTDNMDNEMSELTPDGQLILYNERIVGSVELKKIDAGTTEALKDAVFDLYKEDPKELISSGWTTDEDGHFIVEDLVPGEYYFVETTAPGGYILDEQPISFKIESSSDDKQPERKTIKVKNNRVVDSGTAVPVAFKGMLVVLMLGMIVVASYQLVKKNRNSRKKQ